MKVGLVVESTTKGLEAVVCPKVLELLSAETGKRIDHVIRTMTNKKLLILGAADTVRILLQENCDRVVVLWDENPPWTPEKDIAEKRCWHVERQELITNLRNAQIDRKKVGLVCIEREFETWLLHAPQLLRDVISTRTHKAKVKAFKPLTIDDPKAALMSLFAKNKTHFNPDVAAMKFARHLSRLDQLKGSDTFRYFAQNVLGVMPKGWNPFVYHPKGPRQ